MRSVVRRIALGAVGVAAGLVAGAVVALEAACWRASWAVPASANEKGDTGTATGEVGAASTREPSVTRALLVLGCPTGPYGTPSDNQRWRSMIAARTARPSDVVVFSGGPDPSDRSEAATMALLARGYGLDAEIHLEEKATSTWENVSFSLPELQGTDEIIVVSDPLHAWRGRRFVRLQRPDLAGRLRRAHDYQPGEHLVAKARSAIYEALVAYREWRTPRLPK